MSETGLPQGWEVRHSTSRGLPYYFNTSSKESRWEPPAETDTEKLKAYMATKHSSSGTTSTSTAAAAGGGGGGGGSNEGKIRAAHLLIKHKDSRRPSSWRESVISRSKEDARGILEGHEKRIRSGEVTLGDLATKESDCSSARTRGDLGYFGRGQMQKPFEDAAFGLKKDEVSGIVESDSGLHLIQRLD